MNVPLPLPNSTLTPVNWLTTIRSVLPSPLKSFAASAIGEDPAAKFAVWEAAVANPRLARVLFQTALDLAEGRQGTVFVVVARPCEAIGRLIAPHDVLSDDIPCGPPPELTPEPGPDAGSLTGRLVGLRTDETWQSWEWVLDEWKQSLDAAGASVRVWSAGNRIGEEGERTFRELDEFAAWVDVAIVGLGN